eukprot:GAHX01001376.1.p2 GENE.GAHX01001376.1~~GAHX01001376.1.p2  ORF type:complete len:52 (+),score=7.96 GAHX01001376.1:183-338(+)
MPNGRSTAVIRLLYLITTTNLVGIVTNKINTVYLALLVYTVYKEYMEWASQ